MDRGLVDFQKILLVKKTLSTLIPDLVMNKESSLSRLIMIDVWSNHYGVLKELAGLRCNQGKGPAACSFVGMKIELVLSHERLQRKKASIHEIKVPEFLYWLPLVYFGGDFNIMHWWLVIWTI